MWELVLQPVVNQGIAYSWRAICSVEAIFIATICFIFALGLYYRLETIRKYKKLIRGIMLASIVTGIAFITAGGIIFSSIFIMPDPDTAISIEVVGINSNISMNSSVCVVIQINNETTIFRNSTYYDGQLTTYNPGFSFGENGNVTVIISSYYQANNFNVSFKFNHNYNYSLINFKHDGENITYQIIEPVASNINVLDFERYDVYDVKFTGEDGEITISIIVSEIVY